MADQLLKLIPVMIHPLQVEFGNRGYNEGEFFHSYIAGVKTKTAFFSEAHFFKPEIQLHDHFFHERKFIVLAQVFFHDHKLEITHGIVARQAFVATDDVHFIVCHQVFHYLPKHQVDPWFHPEAEPEIHADNIIGYDVKI